MKYNRVLLKLSGEALAGKEGHGIDPDIIGNICDKIKEIVFKIYDRINNRILDYRYKVNKNAGLCFSYYLIMSIIPICSLIAFFASVLNVDLSVIEEVLQKYFECNINNWPSIKTILSCGGSIHHKDDKHIYLRIKK